MTKKTMQRLPDAFDGVFLCILPEREWGRHRLYSTDHTGRTDKGGFYRDGTGA